jgi:hypothetical protein
MIGIRWQYESGQVAIRLGDLPGNSRTVLNLWVESLD